MSDFLLTPYEILTDERSFISLDYDFFCLELKRPKAQVTQNCFTSYTTLYTLELFMSYIMNMLPTP